jgi:hypothetical protein
MREEQTEVTASHTPGHLAGEPHLCGGGDLHAATPRLLAEVADLGATRRGTLLVARLAGQVRIGDAKDHEDLVGVDRQLGAGIDPL